VRNFAAFAAATSRLSSARSSFLALSPGQLIKKRTIIARRATTACSFDFLRLADGHTDAGIEPGYLIGVIDGFLSEPEGVVLGGDRAALLGLRNLGPALQVHCTA
jgi:hypothetical protein